MDKMIIEYGIAAGCDHFELAGIVNKQIQQGFQPYEKPFHTQHGEETLICQAMVMYGDQVKKKSRSK